MNADIAKLKGLNIFSTHISTDETHTLFYVSAINVYHRMQLKQFHFLLFSSQIIMTEHIQV